MTDGKPPFQCDKCSDKDREYRNCGNRLKLPETIRALTEYTDEINDELEEHNVTDRKVFIIGNLRFYECPLSYISQESIELIRLIYLIADTNRLLHPGEWGSQPYWLVEAYEIYRRESQPLPKETTEE